MPAGGTEKVKVTPRKSVTAAKKAVSSGGKSLVDEDTGTTVGKAAALHLFLRMLVEVNRLQAVYILLSVAVCASRPVPTQW